MDGMIDCSCLNLVREINIIRTKTVQHTYLRGKYGVAPGRRLHSPTIPRLDFLPHIKYNMIWRWLICQRQEDRGLKNRSTLSIVFGLMRRWKEDSLIIVSNGE